MTCTTTCRRCETPPSSSRTTFKHFWPAPLSPGHYFLVNHAAPWRNRILLQFPRAQLIFEALLAGNPAAFANAPNRSIANVFRETTGSGLEGSQEIGLALQPHAHVAINAANDRSLARQQIERDLRGMGRTQPEPFSCLS